MERISTAGSYQSVLLNIMNAEARQNTAQQQYATGKLASDLAGYSAQADQITAAQSLSARTDTYVQNNTALADRLNVQDQTLNQMASITQNARNALAEALATGDATALQTSLQSQVSQAVAALNTQYNGRYLFAGGETSQPPVAASTSLTSLGAPGGSPAAFKNGTSPQQDRLDDQTRLTTGFTASAVGSKLFDALAQVQTYLQVAQAANGGVPITKLSPGDSAALQGMLSSFDTAFAGVNDQVAQNGLMQNQVDNTLTGLKNRQDALTTTLGDLTNVDQAAAATKLQLAQTALQASAQVFSSLKGTSLLSTLSG
jgi:flagellar hook-associated protein 3 FlgL